MNGARTRIRLRTVQESEPADKLARARLRYGRPFGHERGSQFVWTSGPSVLTRWLHSRSKA